MNKFLLLSPFLLVAEENVHNFKEVYVNEHQIIRDVKMIGNDIYYNNKKIDGKYTLINCKTPQKVCLTDKKDLFK